MKIILSGISETKNTPETKLLKKVIGKIVSKKHELKTALKYLNEHKDELKKIMN